MPIIEPTLAELIQHDANLARNRLCHITFLVYNKGHRAEYRSDITKLQKIIQN